MTKRNKFKGQTIARFISRTGCSYEQAEFCYAECARRIYEPLLALAVGMITHKITQEYLGQETISRN